MAGFNPHTHDPQPPAPHDHDLEDHEHPLGEHDHALPEHGHDPQPPADHEHPHDHPGGEATPDVGTRYVAEGGDDQKNGSSWATAKSTVVDAVQDLPTAGSGSSLRHSGTVRVGAGVFDETQEIEYNAGLRVRGNGTGTGPGSTVIRRAHDGHLFSYTDAFTDWGHHLKIENLTLDGNKSIFPAEADLVRTYRPGFNAAFRDVFFRHASRYGVRQVDDAVNLYFYNCTGGGCERGFFNGNIEQTANGYNVAMFGTQIDDCGTAPIHIDDLADGGNNVLMVYGLETESESAAYHEHVIRVNKPSGDNGMTVIAEGISAFRADGQGDAVCKRIGGGANPVWTLSNIHGSGYNMAFHDAVKGTVSGGRNPNHIYHTLFSDGSRGIQIGNVLVLSGEGSPEGQLAAPPGSPYFRENGEQWVKKSGDGVTGWVKKK